MEKKSTLKTSSGLGWFGQVLSLDPGKSRQEEEGGIASDIVTLEVYVSTLIASWPEIISTETAKAIYGNRC